MPTVAILKSDDITPATALPIAASAGSESAQTELHVWYSKGTAGGTAKNLRLVAAAESKTSPGTLVYSGVPCLDRGWLKVRVSGTMNPGGAAGLLPQSTGWYPVSSGLPLTLFDLPGNCARKVFVKLATPIDVGQVTEDWNLYLVPTWEDVVTPLPLGLRGLGGGILSGIGDVFVTEPVTLATITPSSPADAVVHLAGVDFVVAGLAATVATADVTLDQSASDGALAVGQSYIAAITVTATGGGTIVVQKGAKATTGSADPPALSGAGLVCYVEVAYNAGGSAIGSGAITNATRDTRFKVTVGAGMNVSIGPGRALLPGVFIDRRDAISLALTLATTYVFLAPDGTVTKSSVNTPLYEGSQPLAKVDTAVGVVTTITDLRVIVRAPFNATPLALPGEVAIVDDVDFGGHAIVNATGVVTSLDGSDIALGDHTVSGGLLSGMALTDALDANFQAITNLPTPAISSQWQAANMAAILMRPAKTHVRLCATAHVSWPDIAVNGGFDTDLSGWTAGAGWTWDGIGAALHTAGSVEALAQSHVIVAGVRYRLALVIGGTTGTVAVEIGGSSGPGIDAGAGATERTIVAGTGGTLDLIFTPSTDFDGTIDSVVLEPTFLGTPSDPDMDGETIADADRLLLTAQDDPTQNGKYIASLTGPWTRHPDCDSASTLYAGCHLYVRHGTVNGHQVWIQTADVADLATDAQTWEVWGTI